MKYLFIDSLKFKKQVSSRVTVITKPRSEACVPARKYCVVKVVLKNFAVRDLLHLLLQLVVRLGAGAAAPPGGRLVGEVPLLLVLAVKVGRLAGRQLHACKSCWVEGGGALGRHRAGGGGCEGSRRPVNTNLVGSNQTCRSHCLRAACGR